MLLAGSGLLAVGVAEEFGGHNLPEGTAALGSCWHVLQTRQVEEVLVSARWCSTFDQA